VFQSCDKEEAPGLPTIEYVRDIELADPVTKADLGATIAIIGNNLATVKSVTFNGTPGIFHTTMVTNTSIVVKVSKATPFVGEGITNKVVVVTDGGTAEFELKIAPPAPTIASITPEYAGAGSEVVISGAYFYNIESVSFTGGGTAQIISNTADKIVVKVPANVTKGAITVKSSVSGEAVSTKTFGAAAGEIVNNWNSISSGGWWNNSASGPDASFGTIGLDYKYVTGTFGDTWWTLDGGINFPVSTFRKGLPATKALKFEYNLVGDEPWVQVFWKASTEHKFVIKDLKPTGGKWVTYTIKMSDFKIGDDGAAMTQAIFEEGNPMLIQFAFVNQNGKDITIKCAMTNFRITEY
jgi:hypothetical protein